MARKAADAAIGVAKRTLIEYGKRAGRTVVLVPPAYTTMTCSKCGENQDTQLLLAERTFRCVDCGYTADRDRNAAGTILATAERNRAGVDGVRHLLPTSLRGRGYGCCPSQKSRIHLREALRVLLHRVLRARSFTGITYCR